MNKTWRWEPGSQCIYSQMLFLWPKPPKSRLSERPAKTLYFVLCILLFCDFMILQSQLRQESRSLAALLTCTLSMICCQLSDLKSSSNRQSYRFFIHFCSLSYEIFFISICLHFVEKASPEAPKRSPITCSAKWGWYHPRSIVVAKDETNEAFVFLQYLNFSRQ